MANPSKKVLGAGLDALFSDLQVEVKTYDNEGKLNKGVSEIAIDLIDANKDQPRKNFDEEELNNLAGSIRNFGILQPLLACKTGGRYVIVAGERRYRAAKIAGLSAVPVIVRNYTEQERKEIALIENIQREELNPIEEAFALKSLMQEHSVTQEVLAQRLGKSRSALANTMRLLNLYPEVIEMVREGRLTAGQARTLIAIKDKDTQISYARACADKQMSVRDLEAMVNAYLTRDTRVRTKAPISAELKNMVNDMKRIFATKVKAVGTDSKGRFYIDYYTRDDLERIYSLIMSLKD